MRKSEIVKEVRVRWHGGQRGERVYMVELEYCRP